MADSSLASHVAASVPASVARDVVSEQVVTSGQFVAAQFGALTQTGWSPETARQSGTEGLPSEEIVLPSANDGESAPLQALSDVLGFPLPLKNIPLWAALRLMTYRPRLSLDGCRSTNESHRLRLSKCQVPHPES